MTINEAPNVLVLHLKRFSMGNFMGKINKRIHFPVDLFVETVNEQNCTRQHFSLNGVIVHFGHSIHSGHYIAYIKVRKASRLFL